jgi:hypothetical protein
MLLHILLMNSAGLAFEAYAGNIGGRVANGGGLLAPLKMLSTSFTMLMLSGGIIWLSLSLAGFWKNWRSNIFMAAWYLFTIFPFFASALLPWYYLPAMPAIAYFAILTLASWEGKEKLDRFFYIVFIMLMVVVSIPTFLIIKDTFGENFAQREIGTYLSGKEGVSVVGAYAPGIVAYKVLPELRSGRAMDFGWIVAVEGAPPEAYRALADDYHSNAYPVRAGSFSPLFSESGIFRKDTNISAFHYVAISGEPGVHPKGGTLVYNRSNITVYEVK